LAENVLNAQARLLWNWRGRMYESLTRPLSDDGEENGNHGQEYQKTLDDQGEAEMYLQAYQALLADYREAINSERTLLAAHDVREKKLRKTKAAIKATANDDDDMLVDLEMMPEDLQPEQQVLLGELHDQRKTLLALLNGRAVKSVLTDLTNILHRIHSDTDPERVLVKNAIKLLRELMNKQSELWLLVTV
jgi:E3 ubiquitin-protein ligase SHPRH